MAESTDDLARPTRAQLRVLRLLRNCGDVAAKLAPRGRYLLHVGPDPAFYINRSTLKRLLERGWITDDGGDFWFGTISLTDAGDNVACSAGDHA